MNEELVMNIRSVALSEIDIPYPLTVVGSTSDEKNLARVVEGFGDASKEAVKRIQKENAFSGSKGSSYLALIEGAKRTNNILFVGLGSKAKLDAHSLAANVAGLLAKLKTIKTRRVAIYLPSFAGKGLSIERVAQSITESLVLSQYKFGKYYSDKSKNKKLLLEEIDYVVDKAGEKKLSEKGKEYGAIVADAMCVTRDLGNEPANVMTPDQVAKEAQAMAKKEGLTCKVFKEADLKKMKMGALLGVAQGSINKPNLIVLEKKPKNAKKTICLVGKGVTFDTGGISIKPSKDMEKMKFDMMGAAAVIGTMKAISKMNLPIHIIGITPCVENMPGHNAQRPGDIVTASNNKTIEVINTDAEGRLILADALAYAQKFKPDAIIDLATLTGMCVYTFGDKCMGLMTNNAKLGSKVTKAGTDSGERTWELPMWDDYDDLIKSKYCDIQNVSSGLAGTITAGKFLQHFVADYPWVHLDIAGVAWADSPNPYTPVGATGAGVRLLCQLLKDWK